MRALLLGSQSFLDNDSKVSVHYIAEGLARNGWEVDYVSHASSIFDSLFSDRRERFRRIWIDGRDRRGIPVARNLTEYAFRAPFPARKEFLRADWQISMYPMFLPRSIGGKVYDVCIHDSSNTFLFLPKIRAKHFVYRLSDIPSGFSFCIHSNVIRLYESLIATGLYDEIWAVSSPLAEYASRLNGENNVCLMPNGVTVNSHRDVSSAGRMPRSAVFVGSISPWVDVDLVDQTAAVLPDWTFDFYGPRNGHWGNRSSNLRYRGVVDHESVSGVLEQYFVGLIPFKDVHGLIASMERPLKFYEYLSAGLGVAATNVGSLLKGMQGWASFGRTPREFAGAIVDAASSALHRSRREIDNFLEEHSWDRVIDSVLGRLDTLMRGNGVTTREVVKYWRKCNVG